MRVYDITIYDDTGFALCFMNELELRKTVMDSGPHVENRYKMILQPVLPNITPRLESTWTWEREDKMNRTNLLQTLDRLALKCFRSLWKRMSRLVRKSIGRGTKHLPAALW